jgi:putative peptidoglycan lipid II flippase
MNRFFVRANKRISLGGAATLLVAAMAFGQILGFLRYKLVNANYSAFGPESTDAFFAAFKIPDFFYFTLAAGALGVAFMPFLADRIAKGDKKGVFEISNSLLNLLAIIMGVVAIIILLFAEQLIRYIVAPDLTPEQLSNATAIMRLIAFNPFLFMLSAIFVSVQQSFGRFFFFAISPLFYNASIIASIFIFKDSLGLVGLGIGALAGAILQLLVALFGFIGLKYRYQAKINWRNNDFRGVLRQLPPRSLDQGVDSLNSIVETNFARRLGEGKISFYENAYILHTAPTFLIGTTISTAAFPRLNDRLAQGRPDLFRKDFLRILRTIIWITAPVVIIAFFSRGYLARLIFSREAGDIAAIFGYFAVAIFFRTVYTLMSRWFYAQKDTKTPLYVSLFVIALNIVLAYYLSQHTGYGVEGLAMAQSIVAAVEVGILSVIMIARDRKLLDPYFWNGIFKIASVSGFTIMATYIMFRFLPLELSDKGFITLGTKFGAITAVAISTHILMSTIFNLDESKPVIRKIKKLMLARVKI